MALGKAARFFLEGTRQVAKDAGRSESSQILNHGCRPDAFLSGLVLLLAFPSWCNLGVSGSYHGPRWMGLWDNPNTYGMLMATGIVAAIALLVADKRWNVENGKSNRNFSPSRSPFLADRGNPFLPSLRSIASIDFVLLFIATGMMEVGLLFSYSRGSWLGAVVGLLYVAKSQGKFKLRFALLGIAIIGVVAWSFWNATPDNAPWYAKRLDFGRPSAQHRVAAWKAGFEMLRDHPFGLGWNKTVEAYRENYSPPIGGATAITTNDYLMLGTQLGLPGLICFLAYVGLCFRKFEIRSSEFNFKAACRAGALTMLVAFWFDEGLFTLATGSVFWMSLELGKADSHDGCKGLL
jgi:O-antigen ligase